jgi:hypothetical protein
VIVAGGSASIVLGWGDAVWIGDHSRAGLCWPGVLPLRPQARRAVAARLRPSRATAPHGKARPERREAWAGPFPPITLPTAGRGWPGQPALTSWGGMLPGVRSDVAAVARAIARFEPVSMVVRPRQASGAAEACGRDVELVQLVKCAGDRGEGCVAASHASQGRFRGTRIPACSSTSMSTGMYATVRCSYRSSATGTLTTRPGRWSGSCTRIGRSSRSRSTTWLREAAASTASRSNNRRSEPGRDRSGNGAVAASRQKRSP